MSALSACYATLPWQLLISLGVAGVLASAAVLLLICAVLFFFVVLPFAQVDAGNQLDEKEKQRVTLDRAPGRAS